MWLKKKMEYLAVFGIVCVIANVLLLRMEHRIKQFESCFSKIEACDRTETVILHEKEGDITEKKEPEKLYARAAALYDAKSERILFGKKQNEKLPMASTTKIMTCIVILEHASMEDVVTVSKNAARQPDVQLNMNTGDKYYLKDLLYSLMLESHNDTAVALAEHVGGTVEGFAKLMNKKAIELGCIQTNFVTPNGLDAKDHYTTAGELCKIATYALQNKEFRRIIKTPAYSFCELKSGRKFIVNNKDRFLQMYDGAIGIKTGFTGNAGYCFVGAVEKEDKLLVSSVLGCGWPPNKNYKWSDTKKLMDYGFEHYTMQNFFQQPVELKKQIVLGGKKDRVELETKKINVTMLSDGHESEKIVLELKKVIKAPVSSKTKVGELYYYIDDTIWRRESVYTNETIEKLDFSFAIEKTWQCWNFGCNQKEKRL